MMIRVCSGWNPQGSINYGRRFLKSFDRYWPGAVELQVYVEQPESMPRDAYRDLSSIPGANELRDFMASDPKYAGRDPSVGRFKRSEAARCYSFRWDAQKFWKQIVIPQQASDGLEDDDILIWLDGDVETTKAIPADFIENLMDGYELAYLGRARGHAEIGFWAIRITPKAKAFLIAIADCYRSGDFEKLEQWHSSWIWGHMRSAFNFVERDLSPGGLGHVWPRTILAPYMRHDKGMRKPGGSR